MEKVIFVHPLIDYLKKIRGMTSLQVKEYYNQNFHNKIFTVIGNIIDINESSFSIKTLLSDPIFNEENKPIEIKVSYGYEERFKEQMLNLHIDDIVECSGILTYCTYSLMVFELKDISTYTPPIIAKENNETKFELSETQYFILWAFLFVALTILFIWLGGWWWLAAVPSAVVAFIFFGAAS